MGALKYIVFRKSDRIHCQKYFGVMNGVYFTFQFLKLPNFKVYSINLLLIYLFVNLLQIYE